MPDKQDDRLRQREVYILEPQVYAFSVHGEIRCSVTQSHIKEKTLQQLWGEAETTDKTFLQLTQSIRQQASSFPSGLGIKVSISECSLDQGKLCFRGRRWVPASEPLRTRMMQETHDSMVTGHPGHNTLYALMARNYFWLGMSLDIKRFCRNCDSYGSNRI